MEIDIEKYLTEDEIKSAITDAIKSSASSLIKGRYESYKLDVLIGNVAIYAMQDFIDKSFGADFETLIRERVKKELEKDGFITYRIFRDGSFGEPKSKAHLILESAVEENRETIKDKVVEMINNIDYGKVVTEKIANLFGELSDLFYKKSNTNQ